MSFQTTKLNAITLAILSSTVVLSACNSSDSNEQTGPAQAKNVILMITDGASDGAWDISSYWTHGEKLNDVEPYLNLETRLAMSTQALSNESAPIACDEDGSPQLDYHPEQAWDETAINDSDDNYTRPFAGYKYLNENYTDSAAAGSAIATGSKTYLGAISVDYCGRPMELITDIAKASGRATGIVSSVPFDHATPAVFGASNISRHNYATLGHDMLIGGRADLIMGTGHPEYDHNGALRDEANFKYISQDDWTALHANALYPSGAELPWKLMQDKADFEALANNTADSAFTQGPLFGLVPVGYTLQQGRECADGQDASIAFDCDMLPTIPSLEVMTKGALNYLSQNENGMFLMVEGGAVDWAAHGNDTARIIEEQVDFNNAVQAVYDWVEQNSSWEETLLIVTTDHGNSYVLGESSDQVAYAKVENPGAGVMPQVKYFSGSHTKELVRIYAKGQGEELFSDYIIGTDEKYAEHYNHSGATGEYTDNTHLFDVMNTIMTR